MSSLPPGANAALAPSVTLRLTTDRAHADLVVLCVRGDGTADGDDGVALWSQPSTAGGAITIDTATDTVTVGTGRVPADVQRLLVVAQADGVPDMSGVGGLRATVAAGGAAVGREKDFPFLQKLDDLKGREVDNASFFATPDPLAMTDDEFYAKITTEFPQWIEDARTAGILG